MSPLAACFPEYTDFEPSVPVHCVTPGLTGVIHRFYDTSPFSPSGRYLALTRLPVEHRSPRPGEVAQVVIVDLESGTTQVVAETRGWDTQLGAQVQWGADDESLFFNDVDLQSWSPFGVRLNPTTGDQQRLAGTVYMVSPDGNWSVSPCLLRTTRTQAGYGVVVPHRRVPANRGASPHDGIYLTNTTSGESRLLVSLAQIVVRTDPPFCPEKYRRGDFYGFHVKWNPQGTRLMFVLRWLPRPWGPRWLGRRNRQDGWKNVLTMDREANEMRVAISDSAWQRGGHHPNWCPDGEHVLMNLNTLGDGLQFVMARHDGSTCETLVPALPGSGHPTMHSDQRHILTDAYQKEPVAFGDGTVPIRWIDLEKCQETTLVRIRTRPDSRRSSSELRVDPHPAWDRSFRRIAFNACPRGKRQVFVADLSSLVDGDAITQTAISARHRAAGRHLQPG